MSENSIIAALDLEYRLNPFNISITILDVIKVEI